MKKALVSILVAVIGMVGFAQYAKIDRTPAAVHREGNLIGHILVKEGVYYGLNSYRPGLLNLKETMGTKATMES